MARRRFELAANGREGLPHAFGLVGVELGLDAHHAEVGVAAAHVAHVVVATRVIARTLQ